MTLPTLRTVRNAALTVAIAGTLGFASAHAQAYAQQQNNSNYPNQQTNPNYQGQNNPNNRPSQPYDRNQQTDAARGTRGVNAATSDMSVPDTDAPHSWTQDQILTATVHQAWELSGKSEANFFEIVKELAEISARNRELIMPNTPDAGRRAGEYIKEQSRADHDQLLYDIVDKAVRMTGTPAPQSADNRDHDSDNRTRRNDNTNPGR